VDVAKVGLGLKILKDGRQDVGTTELNACKVGDSVMETETRGLGWHTLVRPVAKEEVGRATMYPSN
jgi:hypothetical protein